MKRAGAGAAALCLAIHATARAETAERARQSPRRDEIGLRLGAARPFCQGACAPHFGPAGRVHLLFALSSGFKMGFSIGHARFTYADPASHSRFDATTSSLRYVVRGYPVMGRRAGLFFDLGVGLVDARMGSSQSNWPALGLGAGVPIVVVPWLRFAPYVAGLFHPRGSSGCLGLPGRHSIVTDCSRPLHSGFVSFGVEATALFQP